MSKSYNTEQNKKGLKDALELTNLYRSAISAEAKRIAKEKARRRKMNEKRRG